VSGDVGVVLVTGLALGAAYALVGVAVSAVAIAARTLHLAVGEVLVVGVLASLYLQAAGVPRVAAVALAIASGAVVGALLEVAVVRWLTPGVARLVGLAVAAAAIQALAARTLTTRTFRPRPLLLGEGTVSVGGLALPRPVIAALVVGVPVAVTLAAVMVGTRWGRRLRVVGGSAHAAALGGVSDAWVRVGAFAVSGAAAVLAGLLVAPVALVGAGQGMGYTVRGVAAAALLGSSPLLALPGGLAIGIAESVAQSAWPSVGGDVAVGVVVVVVLVARRGELRAAWGRAW